MDTECIPNGDKFMSLFGIHFFIFGIHLGDIFDFG